MYVCVYVCVGFHVVLEERTTSSSLLNFTLDRRTKGDGVATNTLPPASHIEK